MTGFNDFLSAPLLTDEITEIPENFSREIPQNNPLFDSLLTDSTDEIPQIPQNLITSHDLTFLANSILTVKNATMEAGNEQ